MQDPDWFEFDLSEGLAALGHGATNGRDAGARLSLNSETVEQDLARVVLGLMELLRQLMELQAIRRVEAGSLTADQEEALGLTLMRSEQAIHKVAAGFGLTPGDLSLDLGPLGRTV
ncbi:MAG: gas vesicle protein K [Pseudomonadota bacterium]